MNKTDRFKKKLQIVLYILLILSILRSFLVRARAEGLDSYYLDTLRPMFPDFTDEQWSVVETCAEDCPYFIKLDSSNSAYRILVLYPFSSQYIYDHSTGVGNSEPCYSVGGSSSTIGVGGFALSPYSLGNISRNSSYSHYAFVDYLVNHEAHGMKYTPSSQTYDSSSSWNMRWFSCSTSSVIGSTVSVSFNYSRDSYLTNDNCVFETNYTAFTKFEQNIEKPVYVDDSRFHARTYLNAFDQNMLEVKWDSSVYPSSGSMNYLKSILQLTIDLNDTPVTVSFDSEEYPDLFPTENSSYIPYYFLDSVGNIVDISDLDSAYLTRIELTQYAYPSGAPSSSATSYYAQTSYSLSLTDTVQLPVWDDPVIIPAGGHIIDIATGNVYDNVSFSPPDGYSQQHLSTLESVPWADVKVVSQVALSGNVTDTLDSLYKDFTSLILQDWNYFYDKAFTDFNDVAGYMQADNQYTDTYDIIIFLWNDNNSDLCWVSYTERYYIRLMYKQFGNFQTIMEGGFAYVSDIYNYMYDRFEPLNNNLISFFDSTLSNDSVLLKYVRSINGYCNSINSGIDRIIGSGGRSLTDIYNRLGDLSVGGGGGFILSDFMNAFENKMNYLFVPTYDGLEDTFDTAIDDLGILALPFVFSSDLITACKVPYSNTLDITFPSMSIPWHEEMEGGSVDSTLVLWEDYDVSFNPASVIPSEWLEFFQYLNALLVLVSVTLMTYRHIFSRHASESEGTL